MTERLEVRLCVTGLVQGVGYRWSMTREARSLGLAGWVRNRRDGSVEAQFAGPRQQVERLIVWAGTGPPAARVREVAQLEPLDQGPLPDPFDERTTV